MNLFSSILNARLSLGRNHNSRNERKTTKLLPLKSKIKLPFYEWISFLRLSLCLFVYLFYVCQRGEWMNDLFFYNSRFSCKDHRRFCSFYIHFKSIQTVMRVLWMWIFSLISWTTHILIGYLFDISCLCARTLIRYTRIIRHCPQRPISTKSNIEQNITRFSLSLSPSRSHPRYHKIHTPIATK